MQLKHLLFIFIIFTFTISVAPDDLCKVPDKPLFFNHAKSTLIVQKLENMVNNNNWTANFTKAVSDAHNTGVTEMVNIKNLTDYYNFLNYLVGWKPSENETGTLVYRMLCTMHFVLDQDTTKQYQSPIQPGCGPLTELSKWMVDFANDMGKFLNTTASLTNETLQTFYTAQDYDLDSYEIPKGGWLGHTFNEFFARNFTPGTRPIDGPNNTAVIVSAADSTYDGCWNIDDNSNVTFKGITWSIKELLQDSPYAKSFAGGKFMHSFLGPYDYHRLHAPVGGTVLEARVIPGQVYLEVVVKNSTDGKLILKPIRKLNDVDAPDSPGYQFCQARGLIVIDSPIGLVAVLPVGMCQVSSVVLSTYRGAVLKKRDEIAYFQFGGSDIVLVFQNKSQVDVTAILEKHYRVGQQIAIAHNIQKS